MPLFVKSTSGKRFRLGHTFMTSSQPGAETRYGLSRFDLWSSLYSHRIGDTPPDEKIRVYSRRNVHTFSVKHHGRSLSIGCMRFNGENFRTLRNWAFGT